MWALHHGDCLDPVSGLASLADRSVDVTITDPPYEAEAHTLQRRYVESRSGERTINEAPLNFDAITPAQRSAVAVEIARVTVKRAVVFCQVEAVPLWRDAFAVCADETDPLVYRRTLVWTKPDAMPSFHGRYPGQAFEAMILVQRWKAPRAPVGGKARIYEECRAMGPGGTKAPHPTTKTLPLMLDLVADFTDPDDLILDPFAGSGTTGLAALRLGRRFVGWERDANYHAIATRRLNGDEAKPRPEQPSLFGGVA